MVPALEVRDLRKEFVKGHPLFQNLNLTVEPGERVAILGSNGSGKTTFLRTLLNLSLATSGTVRMFNQSVDLGSAEFRQKVCWVPTSENGFYSRLSGLENLLFFAALGQIPLREARLRIQKLREVFDVEKALESPFFLCSSGMKQILSLSRALISQAPILVFDEPTRSLDTATAGRFRQCLMQQPQSPSVLFSTHSLEEALMLGTRQLEMKDGRLNAVARPEKPNS